jgi:hypothetical protein
MQWNHASAGSAGGGGSYARSSGWVKGKAAWVSSSCLKRGGGGRGAGGGGGGGDAAGVCVLGGVSGGGGVLRSLSDDSVLLGVSLSSGKGSVGGGGGHDLGLGGVVLGAIASVGGTKAQRRPLSGRNVVPPPLRAALSPLLRDGGLDRQSLEAWASQFHFPTPCTLTDKRVDKKRMSELTLLQASTIASEKAEAKARASGMASDTSAGGGGGSVGGVIGVCARALLSPQTPSSPPSPHRTHTGVTKATKVHTMSIEKFISSYGGSTFELKKGRTLPPVAPGKRF